MRIYYRDLNDWHKAGQVGKVGSYEIGLKKNGALNILVR